MSMQDKNNIIINYLNKKIIEFEKNGINLSDDYKQRIYSKFLNRDNSIDEIIQEINVFSDELYNLNEKDKNDEDLPQFNEPYALTFRKTHPKFGTINNGYSHIFIISLIVIIIIILVVIYLAYLTIN